MANFAVIGVRLSCSTTDAAAITHIAYFESTFNPRVVIPIAEAVRRIRLNSKEFYIKKSTGVIYVEALAGAGNEVILKTRIGQKRIDELLRLQKC